MRKVVLVHGGKSAGMAKNIESGSGCIHISQNQSDSWRFCHPVQVYKNLSLMPARQGEGCDGPGVQCLLQLHTSISG